MRKDIPFDTPLLSENPFGRQYKNNYKFQSNPYCVPNGFLKHTNGTKWNITIRKRKRKKEKRGTIDKRKFFLVSNNIDKRNQKRQI